MNSVHTLDANWFRHPGVLFIVVIAGTIFIALGVIMMLLIKTAKWKTAVSRVIAVSPNQLISYFENSTRNKVTVEFVAHGRRYISELISDRAFRVNEALDIKYNPSNPNQIELNNLGHLSIARGVMAFGITVILIHLALLWTMTGISKSE